MGVWTKAVAIVPAAGSSLRMGRDKLLLPWGETVVLAAVLASLRAGGAERVVVVASATNAALLDWLEETDQEWTLNERPEEGMLSSVWAGLSALGGGESIRRQAAPLLICPGDLPEIDPATVERLLEAIRAGASLAVPTFLGRRGHPLAVAPVWAAEIPAIDPEIGLRQLLELHRDGVTELTVEDEGILRDLDTPEDYRSGKPRPE